MSINPDKDHTHFGFKEVPTEKKASLVAEVFDSVTPHYNLMNDLMSLGLHRLWKAFTIEKAALRPGLIVLDVASGTGDLAYAFAKKVGEKGLVVMTDINANMLKKGRDRLIDKGIIQNIACVQADAESLPFIDNLFDRITIAFGLRNVTDKMAALRALYRVLKPGGYALILEFSHPTFKPLRTLYDCYSFKIIPKIGEMIAKDKASYQYLVESIRLHPDQNTLTTMMQTAGFEDVHYFNLSGGIVALHIGYKY